MKPKRNISREEQLLLPENYEIEGFLFLEKCAACDRKNYKKCVDEGVCYWCNWSEEAYDLEQLFHPSRS